MYFFLLFYLKLNLKAKRSERYDNGGFDQLGRIDCLRIHTDDYLVSHGVTTISSDR